MEVGFKSRERYGGVNDWDSELNDLSRGLASGNRSSICEKNVQGMRRP